MIERSRKAVPDTYHHRRVAWSESSYALVLPIMGAVAIIIGLSLALGWKVPWSAYTPSMLVVVGVASLASGVALASSRPVSAAQVVVPSQRSVTESWVICPSCSARSLEKAVPPHHHSAPNPPSPAALAAEPSIAEPRPAPPGEALWASWVPAVGKLPADLVGPVPETAYVPHRPGMPSLYEEGEPIVLGNAPEAGAAARATPDPLDLVDRSSPETLVAREFPEPGAVPPTRGQDRSGAMLTSELMDTPESILGELILWEALNPTPPHLRTRTTPADATGSEGPARPHALVRAARCASCADPVHDPADWRRCPECLSLMCAECKTSALATNARGCCAHCAELQNLDSLVVELSTRNVRTATDPGSAMRSDRVPPGTNGAVTISAPASR
jgi:hypothetical protein